MQSFLIRTTQSFSGIKNFSDFSRFEWSPQLYLSELHRFRLQVARQNWIQSSKLLNRLFRLLEELIFDDDGPSLKLLLQSSTNFISSFQDCLRSCSQDLHSNQLQRMETQLNLLEVNASSNEMIKEMAVGQLSSLMGKCTGKVEVQNEIQTIAFILDRFLREPSLKEENLDYTFSGQVVEFKCHRYIIELSEIEKIISLESSKFHSPLGKNIFYHYGDQLLPIIDPEGHELYATKQSLGVILGQQHERRIIPIDALGDLVHNVRSHQHRRTAYLDHHLFFKLKSRVS